MMMKAEHIISENYVNIQVYMQCGQVNCMKIYDTKKRSVQRIFLSSAQRRQAENAERTVNLALVAKGQLKIYFLTAE